MLVRKKLLILTHSAGFRHSYLPTAVEVLTKIGERSGRFEAFATEECSSITAENLRGYDALLFMTTGELPMDDAQKQALLDFVKRGKAFIGVHNATDTFYKFPAYGEMLGGYFQGHPWTHEIRVIVEDRSHPSTRHLPESFHVKEEVYTFKEWRRDRTHVLIRLDNSSVDLRKGTRPDHDYALAWCHGYGEGSVFYTGFGHFPQLWREEWFQKHLLNGILWATRQAT
ncbi:MAG: ThuA domain-containing protein [Candidatus Bathyarchaeia archaeon]